MTTTLLRKCLCEKNDRTACNWCRTPEIEEEKQRISSDCRNASTKVISPTNHNKSKQSEFLAITCNLLKAREKSRTQGQGAIGFGFASVWLKNYRETGATLARSRVQTPLKSWRFQASIRSCLNCVHNCDDHSLLKVWKSSYSVFWFMIMKEATLLCYFSRRLWDRNLAMCLS